MEKLPLSRLAAGVGIIIVGVAALLGALNIINFNDLFQTYWPVLVIAAGLVLLLDDPKQNYLWATILLVFGVVAQLNRLDIVDVNFWQLFWPVVLIAFGWSVLTQRTRLHSNSADKITAILSGADTKNDSANYQGSKVRAILGGSKVDLSNADIKKEATMEILVVMGGIEVIVPETWEVRTSVMPILGGAANNAMAPKKPGAPVLNIVGTALMGGVDIKN